MPDNAPAQTTNPRDDVPDGWYIQIDRQYDGPVAVGPYSRQDVADSAFTDAVAIDDLCQTDCLDAEVVPASAVYPDSVVFLVADDEPAHFGPVR